MTGDDEEDSDEDMVDKFLKPAFRLVSLVLKSTAEDGFEFL